MAFLQIDDQAADHPKLAVLSDRAFRLWFSGCTYAQRFLTNGQLQAAVVPTLRGYSEKAQAELRRIVPPFTAPLWEAQPDGGIAIHDFLKWNQSREDVLARRAEKNARMRAARERGGFHVRGMPQDTLQDASVADHEMDTGQKRVTSLILNHNLTVAKNATAQSSAPATPIHGRRNLAVLNDADPVQCPAVLSTEFQAVMRPRLAADEDAYTALLRWVHVVSDRTVARCGGTPAEAIGKGAFDWWRLELAKDFGVEAAPDLPDALRERLRKLGVAQ